MSIFLSMVKNEENCGEGKKTLDPISLFGNFILYILFYSPPALAAPLILKAKETSELSSETCAALQLCLQLLSKQEEVVSYFHHGVFFFFNILTNF